MYVRMHLCVHVCSCVGMCECGCGCVGVWVCACVCQNNFSALHALSKAMYDKVSGKEVQVLRLCPLCRSQGKAASGPRVQ